MAKKQEYKKKSKTEVPLCQDCLRDSNSKEMTKDMFFWVNHEVSKSLHCIDCIDEFSLKPSNPYHIEKKRGRPKGSKNKKSDD